MVGSMFLLKLERKNLEVESYQAKLIQRGLSFDVSDRLGGMKLFWIEIVEVVSQFDAHGFCMTAQQELLRGIGGCLPKGHGSSAVEREQSKCCHLLRYQVPDSLVIMDFAACTHTAG